MAAIKAQRKDIVTMILDQLSNDQQVTLITNNQIYISNAVVRAVYCQHSTLQLLLSKLSAGERYKIIA